MTSRGYNQPTLKKLFGLSGNLCAFPTCSQELIITNDIIVGDICHIEGIQPISARHNPTLNVNKLHEYDNLILMCKNHHKIIDDDVSTYTTEKLKQIKSIHEEKFRNKNYNVSDKVIDKIIKDYELTQTNLNIGSGTQNITQAGNIIQNFGIASFSDVEHLFEILLERNFPRLKEEAEKTARMSAGKYCKLFVKKLSSINPDEIKKFNEPDLQYILTKSISDAARLDDEELRENLSSLLIERTKNSEDNLKRIVYNEAIETVGKLTIDGLKIITLCFILRYTVRLGTKNLGDLNNYLKEKLSPFLDFKNTSAEFQHIVYAGCGELGIGVWSYINSIQTHPDLSIFTLSRSQLEIHHIPDEIIKELFSAIDENNLKFTISNEQDLEKYLKDKSIEEIAKNSIRSEFNASKSRQTQKLTEESKQFEEISKVLKIVYDTDIKHLSLTSVGIVIGAMYYERITGEKVDIGIWIK